MAGMMKHLASLGLAMATVAAVGCGGSQKSSSAGAATPSCASAAANAGAQLRAVAAASGEAGAAEEAEQAAPLLEKVLAERCAADGWSAELIDGIATADEASMESCKAKMTDAQLEAIGAQMAREGGAPDAEPAPPPPPDDPCGGGE